MTNGPLHIVLVGNPNSGKTSLFNSLTGLNQKVGNFPGVTVDKKTGKSKLDEELEAIMVDLPGTYSLYPKRADEWVSYKVLLEQDEHIKADMVLLVADASNLKRNLLFCSQIIDLKLPVVVALTMVDLAKRKGIEIDIPQLEKELGVPIIAVNPRKNKGIAQLKKALAAKSLEKQVSITDNFIDIKSLAQPSIESVQKLLPSLNDYQSLHYLINHEEFSLNETLQEKIEQVEIDNAFAPTKSQAEEILRRYQRIREIMNVSVKEITPLQRSIFTEKLDSILLDRKWGYAIMIAVLFLLFQSIFWLARFPMNGIEWIFGELTQWLSNVLPPNWVSDLIVNGFIAGLSGILMFVPQIMILFGLITLLEDTGYMARISFLTDKLMRKVGLNGKSVMPMISGFACAVPAIMSARNIENRKEKLLTILITPLMSCSARLPVFTILIALIIPNKYYLGFLSLQGLVMMMLYGGGLLMALIVSYVAKWFIHIKEKSYFILELPMYRNPRWKNVLHTMVQKANIFVFDAGKVIMIISLLLWALSTYGPKSRMASVTAKYESLKKQQPNNIAELDKHYKTELLENSYAGIMGKTIEPAIHPLGYDWKIGIALVTSFAAREVFVGTMATLYSVGESSDETNATLRQKMQKAVKEDGSKVYTFATGISLLIFYLLAMQCMSTLAIVYRETKSWKWPAIQLLYMTGLAYLFSLLAYQLLK